MSDNCAPGTENTLLQSKAAIRRLPERPGFDRWCLAFKSLNACCKGWLRTLSPSFVSTFNFVLSRGGGFILSLDACSSSDCLAALNYPGLAA